jgi:monoterpene epsilon-lactone hydrolase
VLSLE